MAKNRNAAENGATAAPHPAEKKGGCLKLILIALGALVVLGILASLMGGGDKTTGGSAASGSNISSSTTNSAKPDAATSPSPDATEPAAAQTEAAKADVPAEYSSALRQAKNYADVMHMSKKGVYDQLTSEYGGKFKADAAQYAVDNVEADWNANALAKAKDYQDQMAMSPEAIRDQLTSSYGEKFTDAEAAYAIQNLNK